MLCIKNEIKYLGVVLGYRLMFDPYIENVNSINVQLWLELCPSVETVGGLGENKRQIAKREDLNLCCCKLPCGHCDSEYRNTVPH